LNRIGRELKAIFILFYSRREIKPIHIYRKREPSSITCKMNFKIDQFGKRRSHLIESVVEVFSSEIRKVD